MSVVKTPTEVAAENKVKFHAALGALHNDLDAVKKTEGNSFFAGHKFIPLPDMINSLRPVLQKHGFILSQPTDVVSTPSGIGNVVITRIEHSATGLGDMSKLLLPEMSDMQKLGGAITYARRYTLSALLGLEEIDDDGNTAVGNKPRKNAVKNKDGF